MFEFPKGFLWGSATASYQVEGDIENVDWAQAGREGKLPICGKATDHYHLYEKDFDIAKSLSQNAHRFSIEWARIEPEEGKFDQKEIEHYRKVLQALHARGIEPMVTLWHFTLPIWFTKKGGFYHRDAPKVFAQYCEYVVKNLGDEAKLWVIINEPMVWLSGGYLQGRWPPFKKNFLSFLSVFNSLVSAHNLAYQKMKKIVPNLQIGIAQNEFYFESDGSYLNNLKFEIMKWFWNDRFLRKITYCQDFIGLNYYRRWEFGKKTKFSDVDITDMGWGIYPEGISNVLKDLAKYKKPIYITENGLADADDSKRTSFIRDHLHFIKKAIDDGVDVRGYFYWSLLDNFEWSFGFTKRFGLVEVDYVTLERKIRHSAHVYQVIAEKNSIM